MIPRVTDTTENPTPPGIFWPTFAWLAILMAALALSAFRIPLSARFPSPEERLAPHVMIVAQTIASALLFPLLFQSLASAALVVGAGGIFLQIASILSGRTDPWLVAYGVMWLMGVALWSQVVRTPKARMYAVAALSLLSLGGATVAYLSREFGAPTSEFNWTSCGWLGPTVGGLAILEVGPSGQTWAFLGGFWIAGLMAWAWSRRAGRKLA
jgi:hypothetical protein